VYCLILSFRPPSPISLLFPYHFSLVFSSSSPRDVFHYSFCILRPLRYISFPARLFIPPALDGSLLSSSVFDLLFLICFFQDPFFPLSLLESLLERSGSLSQEPVLFEYLSLRVDRLPLSLEERNRTPFSRVPPFILQR